MEKAFYRPQGKLRALFDNLRQDEVLVEGPVRTGKTRALLERSHIFATQYPKSRQLWLRKTRISMNESALQTFEDHVLPEGHYLLHKASRSHRQKYLYNNGAEIILGGMDEPTRILSTEFDIIVVFEATELEVGEWETLITRASNLGMPFRQCLADCNPSSPRHWLNQRFNIQPKASSRTRILSRLEDNPKFYDEAKKAWTPEGVELIAKLETLTGPRYLRLRKGVWAATEGMIFDMWDEAVFVTDEDFSPQTVIAGVDKGYPNPSAIITLGMDSDGRVRVLDEFYKPKCLADELVKVAQQLEQTYKIEYFMVDPSCAELITQMRLVGLTAQKANNDVQAGINCVASYLKVMPNLKTCLSIAPSAKALCKEFAAYRWKEKVIREEPVKEDDHALDALRYGLMEVQRLQGGATGLLGLGKELRPASNYGSDTLTSLDLSSKVDEVETEELDRAGVWE